jgi:hypothetical protein
MVRNQYGNILEDEIKKRKRKKKSVANFRRTNTN